MRAAKSAMLRSKRSRKMGSECVNPLVTSQTVLLIVMLTHDELQYNLSLVDIMQ